MIDSIIAWCLLGYSILNQDPRWAIASGLFAVAAYIGGIRGEYK